MAMDRLSSLHSSLFSRIEALGLHRSVIEQLQAEGYSLVSIYHNVKRSSRGVQVAHISSEKLNKIRSKRPGAQHVMSAEALENRVLYRIGGRGRAPSVQGHYRTHQPRVRARQKVDPFSVPLTPWQKKELELQRSWEREILESGLVPEARIRKIRAQGGSLWATHRRVQQVKKKAAARRAAEKASADLLRSEQPATRARQGYPTISGTQPYRSIEDTITHSRTVSMEDMFDAPFEAAMKRLDDEYRGAGQVIPYRKDWAEVAGMEHLSPQADTKEFADNIFRLMEEIREAKGNVQRRVKKKGPRLITDPKDLGSPGKKGIGQAMKPNPLVYDTDWFSNFLSTLPHEMRGALISANPAFMEALEGRATTAVEEVLKDTRYQTLLKQELDIKSQMQAVGERIRDPLEKANRRVFYSQQRKLQAKLRNVTGSLQRYRNRLQTHQIVLSTIAGDFIQDKYHGAPEGLDLVNQILDEPFEFMDKDGNIRPQALEDIARKHAIRRARLDRNEIGAHLLFGESGETFPNTVISRGSILHGSGIRAIEGAPELQGILTAEQAGIYEQAHRKYISSWSTPRTFGGSAIAVRPYDISDSLLGLATFSDAGRSGMYKGPLSEIVQAQDPYRHIAEELFDRTNPYEQELAIARTHREVSEKITNLIHRGQAIEINQEMIAKLGEEFPEELLQWEERMSMVRPKTWAKLIRDNKAIRLDSFGTLNTQQMAQELFLGGLYGSKNPMYSSYAGWTPKYEEKYHQIIASILRETDGDPITMAIKQHFVDSLPEMKKLIMGGENITAGVIKHALRDAASRANIPLERGILGLLTKGYLTDISGARAAIHAEQSILTTMGGVHDRMSGSWKEAASGFDTWVPTLGGESSHPASEGGLLSDKYLDMDEFMSGVRKDVLEGMGLYGIEGPLTRAKLQKALQERMNTLRSIGSRDKSGIGVFGERQLGWIKLVNGDAGDWSELLKQLDVDAEKALKQWAWNRGGHTKQNAIGRELAKIRGIENVEMINGVRTTVEEYPYRTLQVLGLVSAVKGNEDVIAQLKWMYHGIGNRNDFLSLLQQESEMPIPRFLQNKQLQKILFDQEEGFLSLMGLEGGEDIFAGAREHVLSSLDELAKEEGIVQLALPGEGTIDLRLRSWNPIFTGELDSPEFTPWNRLSVYFELMGDERAQAKARRALMRPDWEKIARNELGASTELELQAALDKMEAEAIGDSHTALRMEFQFQDRPTVLLDRGSDQYKALVKRLTEALQRNKMAIAAAGREMEAGVAGNSVVQWMQNQVEDYLDNLIGISRRRGILPGGMTGLGRFVPVPNQEITFANLSDINVDWTRTATATGTTASSGAQAIAKRHFEFYEPKNFNSKIRGESMLSFAKEGTYEKTALKLIDDQLFEMTGIRLQALEKPFKNLVGAHGGQSVPLVTAVREAMTVAVSKESLALVPQYTRHRLYSPLASGLLFTRSMAKAGAVEQPSQTLANLVANIAMRNLDGDTQGANELARETARAIYVHTKALLSEESLKVLEIEQPALFEGLMKLKRHIESPTEMGGSSAARGIGETVKAASEDASGHVKTVYKRGAEFAGDVKRLLGEHPGIKGALVAAGVGVGIGILRKMRKVSQRDEGRSYEDMSGPPYLPGGSSYEGQIGATSPEVYNDFVPHDDPGGITYTVNASGQGMDAKQLQQQMQSIVGGDASTNYYRGMRRVDSARNQRYNELYNSY